MWERALNSFRTKIHLALSMCKLHVRAIRIHRCEFSKPLSISFSGDFVYITDKAYTEGQIRRMEIRMLETLNFDLGRPLPLNFLRRASKAGFVDSRAHSLAKFVMELTLVEYKMAHVAPSVVAGKNDVIV